MKTPELVKGIHAEIQVEKSGSCIVCAHDHESLMTNDYVLYLDLCKQDNSRLSMKNGVKAVNFKVPQVKGKTAHPTKGLQSVRRLQFSRRSK